MDMQYECDNALLNLKYNNIILIYLITYLYIFVLIIKLDRTQNDTISMNG